MNLKIEVPKIHCVRTTDEWFKDEVFYTLIAVGFKNENGKIVPVSGAPILGTVSEVKEKIRKNTSWRPQINDHEISIDDNISSLSIILALYEEDNGNIHNIYQEVQNKISEILEPDRFNWDEIIESIKEFILEDVNENGNTDFEDIWEAISNKPELSPKVIGGFIYRVAKTVFSHFRQDDLLGKINDNFNLSLDSAFMPREYNFRGHKGKYNVTLQLTSN